MQKTKKYLLFAITFLLFSLLLPACQSINDIQVNNDEQDEIYNKSDEEKNAYILSSIENTLTYDNSYKATIIKDNMPSIIFVDGENKQAYVELVITEQERQSTLLKNIKTNDYSNAKNLFVEIKAQTNNTNLDKAYTSQYRVNNYSIANAIDEPIFKFVKNYNSYSIQSFVAQCLNELEPYKSVTFGETNFTYATNIKEGGIVTSVAYSDTTQYGSREFSFTIKAINDRITNYSYNYKYNFHPDNYYKWTHNCDSDTEEILINKNYSISINYIDSIDYTSNEYIKMFNPNYLTKFEIEEIRAGYENSAKKKVINPCYLIQANNNIIQLDSLYEGQQIKLSNLVNYYKQITTANNQTLDLEFYEDKNCTIKIELSDLVIGKSTTNYLYSKYVIPENCSLININYFNNKNFSPNFYINANNKNIYYNMNFSTYFINKNEQSAFDYSFILSYYENNNTLNIDNYFGRYTISEVLETIIVNNKPKAENNILELSSTINTIDVYYKTIITKEQE